MFENISNLNQFASMKKMNFMWNLKKGGMLLPPPLPELTGSSNKEKNLSSISNKLTSGKRLTPEEMNYLREHAPELYRQAVEANAERSAYESAAKSCRSKADVQNLHARAMTGILATAKTDPAGAQIKLAAITDSHISFIQSSAYNRLPATSNEEEGKDEKKSTNKKSTTKESATKEREDLMQQIIDTAQNMQFALRNYRAQSERQASAEASSKNKDEAIAPESDIEKKAIEKRVNEDAAISRVQGSVESTKAYLQSQGIKSTVKDYVSFASLLNTESPKVEKDITAAPVGNAFVGRAHAAYMTARETIVTNDTAQSTTSTAKPGLRAKA